MSSVSERGSKAGMLPQLAGVGFVYFLLATGTVSAFEYARHWFLFYLFGLLLALLAIRFTGVVRGILSNALLCAIWLAPAIMIYLIMGLRAQDAELFINRIEGAFIITIIAASLCMALIERYGEAAFQQRFIEVASVVLVLTILYKLQFGFFDRQTRFFLNGPIVFSWLMCYSAVMVFMLVGNHGRSMGVAWFLPVFLLAALWSASKGPILALLLTCAKIYVDRPLSVRYLKLGLFAIVLLALLVAIMPIEDANRLLALARIFDGSATSDEDYASVGIRADMWASAYQVFLAHPVFGVGATNWQFHSIFGDLLYPHNLWLELAAETGLIGVFVFAATLAVIFWKTSYFGRLTILFFLVCSSVSGDVSYIRMMLAVPLAAALCRVYGRSRVAVPSSVAANA
jgi:hypothetical protein